MCMARRTLQPLNFTWKEQGHVDMLNAQGRAACQARRRAHTLKTVLSRPHSSELLVLPHREDRKRGVDEAESDDDRGRKRKKSRR
jgi:hypothetical protein